MKSADKLADLIAQCLSTKGINLTRQRLEIARVLLEKRQHLSAEQVLSRVNSLGSRASKATVYNTLKLFVRKGVIAEVIVDPERIYYDSETAPHFHTYDIDTGSLEDIPVTCIQILGLPVLTRDREVERVDVVIRTRMRSDSAIQVDPTDE